MGESYGPLVQVITFILFGLGLAIWLIVSSIKGNIESKKRNFQEIFKISPLDERHAVQIAVDFKLSQLKSAIEDIHNKLFTCDVLLKDRSLKLVNEYGSTETREKINFEIQQLIGETQKLYRNMGKLERDMEQANKLARCFHHEGKSIPRIIPN